MASSASQKKKADQKEAIVRQKIQQLKDTVREFWMQKSQQFEEVWKLLDKEGKKKFANAALMASQQMTDKADQLMPEIAVDPIENDPNHVFQLFWYYNTEDGDERDKEMVEELVMMGLVDGPVEQAIAIRQLAILQMLTRLIDVFDSIWQKGMGAKPKKAPAPLTPELTEVLKAMAISLEQKKCFMCSKKGLLTCSRCRMLNYCSAECQKKHWKQHKPFCKPIETYKAEKTKTLKEKLAQAKKKAAEKSEKRGPKVKSR
jgi:hypothetical protein